MTRPVFFDASYLIARVGCPVADGFTNVNLAYARHFAETGRDFLVRYGRSDPAVLAERQSHRVVDLLERAISARGVSDDACAYRSLRKALLHGGPNVSRQRVTGGLGSALTSFVAGHRSKMHSSMLGIAKTDLKIAEGAVYLNVSQYQFEQRNRFKWLERRADVRPAFLIHDLLPLEYPEFFVPGESGRFAHRIDAALAHGRGLIVTSEDVRARVVEAMARRRHPAIPTFVAPIPSPLASVASSDLHDDRLAAVPYFIMVATIEPRKNHLLLLAIWRELARAAAAEGRVVPKLVLVGRRRHENEQVLDVLDRGVITHPHVLEVDHLRPDDLARLIANACALLLPSFAEGYGLPMVEALTLGTPVVATDAPVFREVTQGCAIHHSAIDGAAWMRSIVALSDRASATAREARQAARRFRPPTWTGYFDDVRRFLKTL